MLCCRMVVLVALAFVACAGGGGAPIVPADAGRDAVLRDSAPADGPASPDVAAGVELAGHEALGEDAATAPADAVRADAPADTPETAPADVPGGTDVAMPPLPSRDEALAELRRSVANLDADWRFRTDPADEGQAGGWAAPGHDDGTWTRIDAGRTWEDQGFAGYDGLGWYRKRVVVPAEWSGSAVRFVASGVDDEYDLYVNGRLVRHLGEAPDRSVWGWRTYTRVDGELVFGAENLLAVRVRDWGGGGGMWRSVELRRAAPLAPYAALLPAPVVDEHPEWVALAGEAWRMAFEKVAFGTPANGFVDAYMDEGFNEQIYQWDSSFIVLFARYGRRLFPVMETLDNFYRNQRPDGYIQRVYSETDGGELGDPSADEPMVNPPLFAWVEREWWRTTGDASRIARVFPVLEAYYGWLQANVRAPEGQGLYYQTDLGSGMDNTPRGDVARAAWVDMSAQQALAAAALADLADAIGREERAAAWREEHAAVAALVNARLWSEADGFYYDGTRAGGHAGVKHIGALWTLLAGVADDAQAARLVQHLSDPRAFYRPHLFPTLAASEPLYEPDGHYWRGSVWAPTNYMVVKGLRARGYGELAREAAESHVAMMAAVYARPLVDEGRIAPEERDGEYATIWECYSPEGAEPATRWDDTYYSRQDFVGWSGLGPIAMLIEDIIGLETRAEEGLLVWELMRTDRNGVARLPFGEGTVSLVADPRASSDAAARIRVKTDVDVLLEVRRPGRPPALVRLVPGARTVEVE